MKEQFDLLSFGEVLMRLSPEGNHRLEQEGLLKRYIGGAELNVAAGALISFDVNFRTTLWSGEEARDCILELLPLVDIFFCS